MATVKYYKMFIKFTCTLFNLPIDHLHKLTSHFSIEFMKMEFIRMEATVCVYNNYIVIFLQVDYCSLKPEKMFELN